MAGEIGNGTVPKMLSGVESNITPLDVVEGAPNIKRSAIPPIPEKDESVIEQNGMLFDPIVAQRMRKKSIRLGVRPDVTIFSSRSALWGESWGSEDDGHELLTDA